MISAKRIKKNDLEAIRLTMVNLSPGRKREELHLRKDERRENPQGEDGNEGSPLPMGRKDMLYFPPFAPFFGLTLLMASLTWLAMPSAFSFMALALSFAAR